MTAKRHQWHWHSGRAPAFFIAAATLLLAFFLHASRPHAAGPEPPAAGAEGPSIGSAFEGQEYSYTLGFWIFNNVAEGRLTLARDGDGYVATLKAHTTGIARWLRPRSDVYVARIEEVDGGKRFRPLSFEKDVRIGSGLRRTVTEIDYENRVMRWKKWKDGKLRKSDQLEIPPGVVYDDPLTAFFNFRFGAYGPIEKGRDYLIKTFPKDDGKEVDITVRIVTDEEFKGRMPGAPAVDGYFADATLDKELFDSESGKVEIFFDRELVPLVVVAKDVIFFGDIKGELLKGGM